jgi:hypothetical protein
MGSNDQASKAGATLIEDANASMSPPKRPTAMCVGCFVTHGEGKTCSCHCHWPILPCKPRRCRKHRTALGDGE